MKKKTTSIFSDFSSIDDLYTFQDFSWGKITTVQHSSLPLPSSLSFPFLCFPFSFPLPFFPLPLSSPFLSLSPKSSLDDWGALLALTDKCAVRTAQTRIRTTHCAIPHGMWVPVAVWQVRLQTAMSIYFTFTSGRSVPNVLADRTNNEKERKTVKRNRNMHLTCRRGTARRHIVCEIWLTSGAKRSWKRAKMSGLEWGEFRKLCGVARSLRETGVVLTHFQICPVSSGTS